MVSLLFDADFWYDLSRVTLELDDVAMSWSFDVDRGIGFVGTYFGKFVLPWDVRTGRAFRPLHGQSFVVNQLQVLRGSGLLVSWSGDSSLVLRDLVSPHGIRGKFSLGSVRPPSISEYEQLLYGTPDSSHGELYVFGSGVGGGIFSVSRLPFFTSSLFVDESRLLGTTLEGDLVSVSFDTASVGAGVEFVESDLEQISGFGSLDRVDKVRADLLALVSTELGRTFVVDSSSFEVRFELPFVSRGTMNYSSDFRDILVFSDFSTLHLVNLETGSVLKLPYYHEKPFPMAILDDRFICNYPNKTVVVWSLSELLALVGW